VPELNATENRTPISIEPRWPIALVVGSYLCLILVVRLLVPHGPRLGTRWFVPSVLAALLLTLIAADPAHVTERAKWLRRMNSVLIITLAAAALVSTAVLVSDLVRGLRVTDSASALLSSGALVWLGNCLVFGLLYWHFDGGGPLARYRGERPYPDFAFTQHMSPEFAPAGWRPHYVDYFILGLTTSTAFSPTDVMPLATWAKLTMALQSLISLAVVGLVIARAVNVFS
jgi:hypothetical protein